MFSGQFFLQIAKDQRRDASVRKEAPERNWTIGALGGTRSCACSCEWRKRAECLGLFRNIGENKNRIECV